MCSSLSGHGMKPWHVGLLLGLRLAASTLPTQGATMKATLDPVTRQFSVAYAVPAGAPEEVTILCSWSPAGRGQWRPAKVIPFMSETALRLLPEEPEGNWKQWVTEGRLTETMWTRRELENYLCSEAVLLEWARAGQGDDLFGRADAAEREQAMRDAIVTVTKALQDLGRPSPWSPDVKASDDVLDPIFRRFSRTLGQRLALRKSDYHLLARHVRAEDVDADVIRVLDQVVAVAAGARPAA